MNKYWIEFFTRTPTAEAVPERRAAGWYRQKTVVVSSNERAAYDEIAHDGGVPVTITLVKEARFLDRRVSRVYMREFLSALLACLQTGVSPGKALESVIAAETGPTRERLETALTANRRGESFADAIRATSWYPSSVIAVLSAGERSGNLIQSLEVAIEQHDLWSEGAKTLATLSVAVVFDLLVAVSSVVALRFKLLPTIENEFSTTVELSSEKRAMFDEGIALAYLASDVLLAGTAIAFLCILLLLVGAISHQPTIRHAAWAVLERLPFVGKALNHTAVSSAAQSGASLMKGGLNFAAVTAIIAKSAIHKKIVSWWEGANRKVMDGYPVATALSNSVLLHPAEKIAIATHQNQQQLAQILARIAGRRLELARTAARRAAASAMTATIAYVVLVGLLAIYVVYLQNKALLD